MEITFDGSFIRNYECGISLESQRLLRVVQELSTDIRVFPQNSLIRSAWNLSKYFNSLNHLHSKTFTQFASKVLVQPQFSPFGSRFQTRIVRVHDYFPISNPEWFSRRQVTGFKAGLEEAMNGNTFYLVNSNSTLKKSREIGIENNRLFLIDCSIKRSFEIQCQNCRVCKHGWNINNFVLTVGTIEPRKNYPELVEFWQRLGGDFPPLVIVGRRGWTRYEFPRNPKIVYLGYICTYQLNNLYRLAKIYVSASLDEGYNMPLHEAQTFGIPIVASDIPTHREKSFLMSFFELGSFESFYNALSDSLSATSLAVEKKTSLTTSDTERNQELANTLSQIIRASD